MTSGAEKTCARRKLATLALALTLSPAHGAEFNADTLLHRLARPAPASVAFKEVRFSSLLREPLIVAGELRYSGPNSLEREVRQPYRERTTIVGESVRIEREGQQPRSFALKRAPELRSLLSGFTAMLTGDAAAMRRDFAVQLSGTDLAWSLELKPANAKARRVDRIVIDGAADAPRCFSMMNSDGGGSVLLLADAAGAELPRPLTPDRLTTFCRAE